MIDYGDRKFSIVKVGPELLFKGEDGRIFNRPPKPRATEDPDARRRAEKMQKLHRLDYAAAIARNLHVMSVGTDLVLHQHIMDGIIYEVQNSDRTRLVRIDGEWFDQYGDVHYVCETWALNVPHTMDGLKMEDWQELLTDYEIAQPFLQLGRPCLPVEDPKRYQPRRFRISTQGIFSIEGAMVRPASRYRGVISRIRINFAGLDSGLCYRMSNDEWELSMVTTGRELVEVMYRIQAAGGVEC